MAQSRQVLRVPGGSRTSACVWSLTAQYSWGPCGPGLAWDFPTAHTHERQPSAQRVIQHSPPLYGFGELGDSRPTRIPILEYGIERLNVEACETREHARRRELCEDSEENGREALQKRMKRGDLIGQIRHIAALGTGGLMQLSGRGDEEH